MRKVILILFFMIVLSFSVRAVCCDEGCYPDANCCGGLDQIGYIGCEATGNVFYCPVFDAVEGTVLPGGGQCLNCLCTDANTCSWDDSDLCPSGEVCLRVDDAFGLPETSWCVNENCQTCADCDDGWLDGCSLDECHQCFTGQCYWKFLVDGECYDCPGTQCSDYNDDPNACNGEISFCDLGNCYWTGSSCAQCAGIAGCEDYPDFNTCDLNPCGLGDCLWDNGQCVTIQPGLCDNDGTVDRGEVCDCGGGSCSQEQLGYKTCEDFGFESGSLGCINCEYDFDGCNGYDTGTCGDGVFDFGTEACDCGGKKICTEEQLNYKTCEYFGYNGGILSCYDTCEFDTRSCRICDKDGNREIGEVCDCGGGSCSDEQLNHKDCTDFNFASGSLDCDANCEYDYSGCNGYDIGTCGDGTLDIGKEACDTAQFGGKICDDFDDFSGGILGCYANCMFDTRECGIPEPDDSSVVCELRRGDYQGECSKTGDYFCWDSNVLDGECCGDSSNDNWIDTNGKSCCQDSSGGYVFQTDPDYSSCFCNLKGDPQYGGTGDAGVCEITNEVFCWSSLIKPKGTGRCCGDDTNEKWSYSTSSSIDNVLVRETCYNSLWKKRVDLDFIYYDLTAEVV